MPLVPPLVVLFIWDFIVGAVSFMHHTDCTLLLLSSILDTYLHERVFFFFFFSLKGATADRRPSPSPSSADDE